MAAHNLLLLGALFIALHALSLGAEPPPVPLTNEETRILLEIETTKQKLEQTAWSWQNRDEKAKLEDLQQRLTRILEAIDLRRAEITSRQKTTGLEPHVPITLTDEEVKLVRQLEELREELRATQWGWSNRDRKDELEKRVELIQKILQQLDERRFGVLPASAQPPAK